MFKGVRKTKNLSKFMSEQLFELYMEGFDYLCRFRNTNHLNGYLNKTDRDNYQKLAEALVVLTVKPNIDIKTLSIVIDYRIEKRHVDAFADFLLREEFRVGRKKCDISSPQIEARHGENCISYNDKKFLGID